MGIKPGMNQLGHMCESELDVPRAPRTVIAVLVFSVALSISQDYLFLKKCGKNGKDIT